MHFSCFWDTKTWGWGKILSSWLKQFSCLCNRRHMAVKPKFTVPRLAGQQRRSGRPFQRSQDRIPPVFTRCIRHGWKCKRMTKENGPLRPNGWRDEWRTFFPDLPGVSPLGRRRPEQRAEGAPGTDSCPGIPTMGELPPLIGMVFDPPGTL